MYRAKSKYLLLIVLCTIATRCVIAQSNLYYKSWADFRLGKGSLLSDSIIVKKRTVGEIMAYRGNDYEFFNITNKVNLSECFALSYQGTEYVQGNALNTGKEFAKVTFHGKRYLVVLAAITEKKRDDYEELDLLYQISDRFSRELEAEINKNRYLYLIPLSKKKPKMLELNPANLDKLMKNYSDLYKVYRNDANRYESERVLYYISLIDLES